MYSYEKSGVRVTNQNDGIDKFYKINSVRTNGIDVSKWQGKINWGAVSRAGINFAIIRDGYGKTGRNSLDRYFHRNVKEAHSHGIKCGVYHFTYAKNENEALAEAEFCLQNIRGYRFEYPIVIDIEDNSLIYLGKQKLTNICRTFCDRLRKEGYYVSIYTNFNWVKNFLYSDSLFKSYDLWLARYNNHGAGYRCGIWQYTASGTINGINSNVDRDICYFDYPTMMRELKLNGFN